MAKKNSHRGRRIPISWLISFVLSLVVAGFITHQVLAQVQESQDEVQVKNTALSAFSTPQEVTLLPGTNSVLENSSVKGDFVPKKADVDTALNSANQRFNNIYSPKCAGCRTIVTRLVKAITGQQDGSYRALGWSVKDVQWSQLVVQGQTASVTLSATLSSKLRFFDESHQAHTVNPTEGLVYIYSLEKTNGRWLITNLVQDEAAGATLPVNNLQPSGQTGGPPPGVIPPTKVNTKVPKTPTPTK